MRKGALAATALILCSIFQSVAQDVQNDLHDDSKAVQNTEILNISNPVKGLYQWEYQLDISGLEKGTYNILVEGKDKAGNLRTAEAVDIKIDPDSDLPLTALSYPPENETIRGNINILGIAEDDDAVDSVEVSFDGGPFINAEGKEHWSFPLNTDSLNDGSYSIRARSTDINGLTGPEKEVSIHLDRAAPEIVYTSHKNGSFAGGKIEITGTASDRNGIAEIRYSLDNGETFQKAGIKGKEYDQPYTFSYQIDTREIPDGALTILTEAVDIQRSPGRGNLLLYIDNTAPEIEIISPREDSLINSSYTVSGRVNDDIGISSFEFSVKGEEPVQIPLIPGNPFWTVSLEAGESKKAEVEFILTDIAGNETTYLFRHPVDRESDRPTLTLLSSDDASEIPFSDSLSGWAYDNRSVEGIRYSLDKGPEQELPSGQVFNTIFSELETGDHKVSVRSFDRTGLESLPQEREFFLEPEAPEIRFLQVLRSDDTKETYIPGIKIDPEEIPVFTGKIIFPDRTGSASYTLPDGTENSLRLKASETRGEYDFNLKLKPEAAEGYYPVEITAEGKWGIRSHRTLVLWFPGGDKEKIYQITPYTDSSEKTFRTREAVEFLYPGEVLNNLELSGNEDFSVSFTEGIIRVTASASLGPEELSVKAETVSGRNLEFGPFTLISDLIPPELTYSEPRNGFLLGESLPLKGSVRDNTAVKTLEYSLNGGDFTPLDLTILEGEDFSRDIPLESIADGRVYVTLKAEDGSGNCSYERKLYIKDTTAPELTQLLPAPEEAVNGLTKVILTVTDEWSESLRAELRVGETVTPLEVEGNTLAADIDLAPYEAVPEDIVISVRDERNNETLYHPEFSFAPLTDKPVVQIHIPRENSLITKDTVFSGIVLDDDGVSKIEYKIDDAEFQTVPGENSFEIPVSLSSLSDNSHTLQVRAFDLGGVVSDTQSTQFNVSLKSPVTELLTPELAKTSRGAVELTGTARDANGISNVYISLDNGNSYKLVEGTEEWHYSLDSSILIDGSYMVLLKGIDNYGIESISSALIKIDNTAPEIDTSLPRDGDSLKDEIVLQMRVNDDISVNRIYYTLTPLLDEGETVPVKQEDLEVSEVVIRKIDISGYPGGNYNLTVFAADEASNEALVSRNIFIRQPSSRAVPGILFPFDGSRQQGFFYIEGVLKGGDPGEMVTLLMDGIPLESIEPDSRGFFRYPVETGGISPGDHTLQAQIFLRNGDVIQGEESSFSYTPEGPWVRIDSVATGDFVGNRPWIRGVADYPVDLAGEEREPTREELKSHRLTRLEYSLDNGKQFSRIKPRNEWKFRLETQELPEGPLGITVKAWFSDGTTALTSVFVEVDERAPDLTVLTPQENSRFNDRIAVSGTAFDTNGLENVTVMLRDGSKASHELPQFIQGLYLDSHFLGGTSWELGAGLTFFDDNVRLQALFGQAPAGRFNGNVFGLKLLANVATLPYGYYFGPDFDFLSSSMAVGSAFEFFTMTGSEVEREGLVLGAMVVQLEFIKVELEQLKLFNTFSFYMENQFWFISSDIEGGLEYKVAFGIRTNVF